jgi:hypothetical protein
LRLSSKLNGVIEEEIEETIIADDIKNDTIKNEEADKVT